MYRVVERPPDQPIFLLVTGQHAKLISYTELQEEAGEFLPKLHGGEITADQLPNITMIPPYGDPVPAALKFVGHTSEGGTYTCYLIKPDTTEPDNVFWTDDGEPLSFEVRQEDPKMILNKLVTAYDTANVKELRILWHKLTDAAGRADASTMINEKFGRHAAKDVFRVIKGEG